MKTVDKSYFGQMTTSLFDRNHIDPYKLFVHLYGEIPDRYYVYKKINTNTFFSQLCKIYKIAENDPRIIYTTWINDAGENRQVTILLKTSLVISFHPDCCFLLYGKSISRSEIDNLKDIIKKHLDNEKHKKGFYLFEGMNLSDFGEENAMILRKFDVRRYRVNFNLSYNSDFIVADKKIKKFLRSRSTSGLVILNGKPGTGKTHYLRHLSEKVQKPFIYIPANMMDYITDPDFIKNLHLAKGSIFVMEDCERILRSRDSGNLTTGITNILNMSDGLLADAFDINLICTFNSPVSEIDAALLRSGRLQVHYEFRELSADIVEKWILKRLITISEPKSMVLSDLYYLKNEKNIEKNEN